MSDWCSRWRTFYGKPPRFRLETLRYATRPEAEAYVAVMRTFTAGISGLLSDQSAAEVRQRLIDEHGIEIDLDTVDIRLSQFAFEQGCERTRSDRAAVLL